MATTKQWLRHLGLSSYLDQFQASGYEYFSQCEKLTLVELEKMGIKDPCHLDILMDYNRPVIFIKSSSPRDLIMKFIIKNNIFVSSLKSVEDVAEKCANETKLSRNLCLHLLKMLKSRPLRPALDESSDAQNSSLGVIATEEKAGGSCNQAVPKDGSTESKDLRRKKMKRAASLEQLTPPSLTKKELKKSSSLENISCLPTTDRDQKPMQIQEKAPKNVLQQHRVKNSPPTSRREDESLTLIEFLNSTRIDAHDGLPHLAHETKPHGALSNLTQNNPRNKFSFFRKRGSEGNNLNNHEKATPRAPHSGSLVSLFSMKTAKMNRNPPYPIESSPPKNKTQLSDENESRVSQSNHLPLPSNRHSTEKQSKILNDEPSSLLPSDNKSKGTFSIAKSDTARLRIMKKLKEGSISFEEAVSRLDKVEKTHNLVAPPVINNERQRAFANMVQVTCDDRRSMNTATKEESFSFDDLLSSISATSTKAPLAIYFSGNPRHQQNSEFKTQGPFSLTSKLNYLAQNQAYESVVYDLCSTHSDPNTRADKRSKRPLPTVVAVNSNKQRLQVELEDDSSGSSETDVDIFTRKESLRGRGIPVTRSEPNLLEGCSQYSEKNPRLADNKNLPRTEACAPSFELAYFPHLEPIEQLSSNLKFSKPAPNNSRRPPSRQRIRDSRSTFSSLDDDSAWDYLVLGDHLSHEKTPSTDSDGRRSNLARVRSAPLLSLPEEISQNSKSKISSNSGSYVKLDRDVKSETSTNKTKSVAKNEVSDGKKGAPLISLRFDLASSHVSRIQLALEIKTILQDEKIDLTRAPHTNPQGESTFSYPFIRDMAKKTKASEPLVSATLEDMRRKAYLEKSFGNF